MAVAVVVVEVVVLWWHSKQIDFSQHTKQEKQTPQGLHRDQSAEKPVKERTRTGQALQGEGA